MVHPTYEEHPFERRARAPRAFQRRLEVFDLILALIVLIATALLFIH